MWFKNLRLFRLLSNWNETAESLNNALETQRFHAGSSQEKQNLGWVPTGPDGRLVHAVDGHYLFTLRTEKKLLPNSVINQVANSRASEIEAEQGWRPGRRQMREIKDEVTDELLPKAFSIFHDTRVWIDRQQRWLVIDAAAVNRANDVIGLLAKTLDPFPIEPVYLAHSPSSAMTDWLLNDQPPAEFTIDQEAELRASDDTRATVRFVRHTITPDDVETHIQAGKRCTRLALTWADRISFVLTDAFEIKRLTPLDILTEQTSTQAANEAEQFDSDFALMTRELSLMFDGLIDALGGEKTA